ncbi:MAG TPA: NAD(P)H-binding protein [Candidatus Acidoferrales bacterium]|nr:NAD(P)H-binding protein [Candidatus Acidoferrales bacterium]
MIAVTGATGHTGKVVAETLLAGGEKVRVIGRNADKLQPFVAKGAEAFVGNVLDTDAMTRAFQGVDAAYVMIPPDLKQPKMRAYMSDVSESLANALEKALVKYAVSLSSVGANLAEGAGPVSGLHNFEQRLNRAIGLNVLHLRPGSFMENSLLCVQVYKTMGFFAALVRGDLPAPQIASRDIGARAAAELRAREFGGQQIKELLGQRDLSMNEAARIFGEAIGKPGLGYTQAPAMMAKPALMQGGLSADTADQMIEMSKAINEGRMVPLEKRNESNTTATTFESFTAEVLVPAYKGQSASA